VLEINGLSKRYEPPRHWLRLLVKTASDAPVQALQNVSFSVRAGEVMGLLGPNGAGKTSLIKVIATLLEPTSGHVTVDGYDVVRDAHQVRQRIGLVLAEDRGVYWRLTGRQNLEFFGVLSGLSRPDAQRRAGELLEQLGLAERDKLVFGYSSGMRARLNLARALLADPGLLVLDEPTRSMDPLASADVAELLRGLAAEGRAVLLASHRLDEVAAVCDRVVVIGDGQVRHVGPPTDLGAGRDGMIRGLVELLEDTRP
jgi:ABC-2 type transport system ATP-binding protein